MRPSISKVNSCFSKVYRFNMALKERTWHQGQTKQLDLLKGRFPNLGSTDRVANKRFSHRQITFGEKTPRSSSLKPPRPHSYVYIFPWKSNGTWKIPSKFAFQGCLVLDLFHGLIHPWLLRHVFEGLNQKRSVELIWEDHVVGQDLGKAEMFENVVAVLLDSVFKRFLPWTYTPED